MQEELENAVDEGQALVPVKVPTPGAEIEDLPSLKKRRGRPPTARNSAAQTEEPEVTPPAPKPVIRQPNTRRETGTRPKAILRPPRPSKREREKSGMEHPIVITHTKERETNQTRMTPLMRINPREIKKNMRQTLQIQIWITQKC